jgi:hypothetical protein
VLVKDGAAVLKAYIDAARPLPIRGLFRFNDFWTQVYDLYQQGPKGLSWGVSTGWQAVDAVYRVRARRCPGIHARAAAAASSQHARQLLLPWPHPVCVCVCACACVCWPRHAPAQVVPGELTVVTGLPNSGKSEWLDALVVNLAQLHGWRIGLCSLENEPKEHARKLVEKYTCECRARAARIGGARPWSVRCQSSSSSSAHARTMACCAAAPALTPLPLVLLLRRSQGVFRRGLRRGHHEAGLQPAAGRDRLDRPAIPPHPAAQGRDALHRLHPAARARSGAQVRARAHVFVWVWVCG